MLSVQPVNFKPAFRSSRIEDIPYEEFNENYASKEEWEGIKDQFGDLETDSNLPSPVRKFAKGMKIISGAVVTALGVIWASKKAGNLTRSAYKSKAVQSALDNIKNTADKVEKPVKDIYNKAADKIKLLIDNLTTKFKETNIGKKVFQKQEQLKNTKFGKIVNSAEAKLTKGFAYTKKELSEIKKSITFDKINDKTADVMGVGAGIATAYDLARENNNEGDVA